MEISELATIKPSEMADLIELHYAMGKPAMFWGKAGIAKSSVFGQTADAMDLELLDIRMVHFDPVDMKGLMAVENNQTVWKTPAVWPTEGRGILLLDEFLSAPRLTLAGSYSLILDRKIGSYVLPPGWVPFAASNYETDKGVTHKMPMPLANRFSHYNVIEDIDDLVTYALRTGWETEVIAFLRARPQLLHTYNPSETTEKAFATPRTWETVSDKVRHVKKNNGKFKALEYAMYSSDVGVGPAVEFSAFMNTFRKIPSRETILMNPKKAKVPKESEPDALYAVCAGLAQIANEDNIDQVVTYSNRLPNVFSVLLITDCLNRDESLSETIAIIEWQTMPEHSSVVLGRR